MKMKRNKTDSDATVSGHVEISLQRAGISRRLRRGRLGVHVCPRPLSTALSSQDYCRSNVDTNYELKGDGFRLDDRDVVLYFLKPAAAQSNSY